MTLRLDTRAGHFADATAVVDDAETAVSYAELDDRARDAADRLAAAGVGEGDAVVVLSRNRTELLALLFAVERLGAVLAPVSHRLPAGDVTELVDRIDPVLVIHEERFADRLPERGTADREPEGAVRTTTFEAFAGRNSRESHDAVARPDPESPLLYLHTGGTTGTPKVVVVTRRQVEWNCITQSAAWGLGNDDVSPVLLPLFHTGGWHLLTLPTLYVGGTVVLRREFDPGRALETVERHDGTHLFGVATILSALAEHEEFADADLSSLEWVMSGGGPTPEELLAAFRERGVPATQGYGLTEGGPSNLYVDPRRSDATAKADTVGRPFPDCEARTVDDDGEPLTVGETGELEVRGPVAAREYLATADGTFGSEGGTDEAEFRADGEWVSTGDLAERDADGDYRIVGRVDNMFVSGGENVHPETVERALESHAAVESVGVVGIPHDRWGTVPKAVVVPAGDATDRDTLDHEALAAHARETLADYERPNAYVFVEALPESGAGKLDRGALVEEYGGETQ